MKRTLFFLFAIMCSMSVFAGCADTKKPFTPPITVEYIGGENTQIMLDYESDLIMDLLNSDGWIKNSAATNQHDYVLTINRKEILYCSETGTFIDNENHRYIIANDSDRVSINYSLYNSLNLITKDS